MRRCLARELESLKGYSRYQYDRKGHARALLTFPHRSHMCGFSPECTRMWTVNADRCMKGLPQPFSGQTCGLSPLCILSTTPHQHRNAHPLDRVLPWRARSLLLANPLPQVVHAKALIAPLLPWRWVLPSSTPACCCSSPCRCGIYTFSNGRSW